MPLKRVPYRTLRTLRDEAQIKPEKKEKAT